MRTCGQRRRRKLALCRLFQHARGEVDADEAGGEWPKKRCTQSGPAACIENVETAVGGDHPSQVLGDQCGRAVLQLGQRVVKMRRVVIEQAANVRLRGLLVVRVGDAGGEQVARDDVLGIESK